MTIFDLYHNSLTTFYILLFVALERAPMNHC